MVMEGRIEEQANFGVAEGPSYLKKLDLGCGDRCKMGFIGVDKSPDVNPTVICDLDQYPYPFDDNSVFEIYTSHFIEHVKDIKKFMEECYRILIPRGMMVVIAPYYSSMRATQDYTHLRSISEDTFPYFNEKWRELNKLKHYDAKCNFEILYINFYFEPEWNTRAEEAKAWARKHYLNVVNDIEVGLRAMK